MGEQENPAHVHVEHEIEVCRVDVQQFVEPAGLRGMRPDAGRCDDGVEPTERLDDPVDTGVNLGDVGHVDRHEHRSATGRFDLSDQSLGPFLHLRQVGDRHRRTLGGEQHCRGRAETAAPAADDRPAAHEPGHRRKPGNMWPCSMHNCRYRFDIDAASLTRVI